MRQVFYRAAAFTALLSLGVIGNMTAVALSATPPPVGQPSPRPSISPLPIGNYVLSSTLPSAPARAAVLNAQAPIGHSNEALRALAQQLQLKPELYRPEFPFAPPTSMTQTHILPIMALGDSREMTVDGPMLSFSDTSGQGPFGAGYHAPKPNATSITFENASKIAEAYLKTQGLLNFNYRIEQPTSSLNPLESDVLVQFTPLIAGQYPLANIHAGAMVQVSNDGKVRNFWLGQVPTFTQEPSTALLNAQEAWQQVVAGQGQRAIVAAQTSSNPLSSTLPNIWLPNPALEQRLDWVGLPVLLNPIEWQGKPLVRLGNLILADYPSALLNDVRNISLAEPAPLHIWGTLNQDSNGAPTLAIENWRHLDLTSTIPYFGLTVVTTNTQGLRTVSVERVPIPGLPESLNNNDLPQRVVLLNAPPDLPKNKFVQVIGVLLPQKQNELTVMAWMAVMEVNVANLTPSVAPTAPPVATPSSNLVAVTDVRGFEPVAAISPTLIPLPLPPASPAPIRLGTATPQPAPTPQPVPYNPGDRVEALAGRAHVQISESFDGKNRRAYIQLEIQPDLPQLPNPFGAAVPVYSLVEGDNSSNFQELAKMDELRIRVWGRYIGQSTTPSAPAPTLRSSGAIEIERFELVNPNDEIHWWIGSIITTTLENRTVGVLQTRAGDRFILRSSLSFNPPIAQPGQYDPWQGYIYSSKQGLVEGVLTNKAVGEMRILDDIRRTYSSTIESATQPADLAVVRVTERPTVIREAQSDTLFVTRVELVYRPEGIGQMPPMPPVGQLPANIAPLYGRLVPTWRFSGKTNRGALVEIMLDAMK